MALYFDLGNGYTKLEKELLEKNRFLNERLEAQTLINEQLAKQLAIQVVGSSIIAEPYLISEKENQIKEMKKLGLFTEGYLFEQNINGLIQVIKDLKEQ